MEQRSAETLKGLRVTTIKSIRQTVATLSGGQRQSVAVARAVMWNSKLVILDEPTAALGVAQTEQVLALVRRLAEQGLAVILISHNLHDIFETATRITVLRLGRNVGVYERATTTQQEVVQAITAGIPTKVVGHRGDRPRRSYVSTASTIARAGARLPAGRAEERREPLAADARQHQVGEPRRPPGRPRRGPDRRVLRLHRDELLHRRELRERHPPDGRGDDDRVRRRLRPAPRRDRPLDRLPERHRGGDGGRDAAPGRAQLPGMARDPDRARGRRGDRHGAGNDRREDRRAVVRRDPGRTPDLAGRDPEDPRATRRDHHREQLDQRRGDVLLLRERRLAHSGDHHGLICPRRAGRRHRSATCWAVVQPVDPDREARRRCRRLLRHRRDLQPRDEAGRLSPGHAAHGELHAVARTAARCAPDADLPRRADVPREAHHVRAPRLCRRRQRGGRPPLRASTSRASASSSS